MKDLEKKVSITEATSGISALVARINEMYGSTALLASAAKPHLSALDVALGHSSISEMIAAQSKWSVETINPVNAAISAVIKNITEPQFPVLAALENKTGLLAYDNGIPKITSVATQISSITGILASQSDYIKELIAPKTMLTDLQTVATQAHKAIEASGRLSAWQLGVIDTASFMVDRQVNWASRFSSATYSDHPFTLTENFNNFIPKVNVIEVLPEELEFEKTQQEDISANDALERTPAYRFSERAKALIEKVATINKICKRTNRKLIFTFSEATMMAAVTLGGTECVNRNSFGDVIDCLYFIFYENIEHIKALVTEESVVNEEVYQCIFRVKDMRTDMRHDIEHGGKSKIKKKNKDIGESYTHYAGKVALTSKSDYQTAQAKLYDEFETLTDHLIEKVES